MFPIVWTDELTGRVIKQGDPGYEEARKNFNARFSRFPHAIVYLQNAQDAVNAISVAKRHGIPLRIRCGGHSYEAFSNVDEGIVVDVSDLQQVQVNKGDQTAVIGAGMRLLPLYEALWRKGVTIPAGSGGGVGVAGLTLGGGFGYLSRRYGMTCDSLQEVELVSAQGQVIRVNNMRHPDLFWALRGGGDGSFGIITSFTFRVQSIGDVAHFTLKWDWNDLEKVMKFWQSWAPLADRRLTSMLAIPGFNQGEISSHGVYIGLEKELRQLLRPLQSAVPPKRAEIRSASWIDAARSMAGSPVKQSKFKNTSAFAYQPFSDEALAMLVKNLKLAPGSGDLVQFDAYGGAVGQTASDATAFVHRNALFMIQYQSYWKEDREAAANLLWVEQFRESMLPYTKGAFRDYCDRLIQNWPDAYWGENVARLKRVKQTYDPDNFFKFEQSIPPT